MPETLSEPSLSKTADLAALLTSLTREVAKAGSSFNGDAARLAELETRLATGRFHLAVLGQFKRGKSTLLNALLGEPILPTGVVPITLAPTWIAAGPDRLATIQLADRREECSAATADELSEFLAKYISESSNPHNAVGVSRVEVFHPAPILRAGVVLIDTPGIGSTLRHNTEATLEFLPQCDAAMIVLSADPPITETEIAFLHAVKPLVSRLFFVLNKIDYLTADEARASLEFHRRILTEQAGIKADAVILVVSAKTGLNARLRGDAAGWQQSGMAELEHHLLDFLAGEKAQALRGAVSLRAGGIAADVVMRLRLSLRALEMPLEDLRQRLESMDQSIAAMQRERIESADLLAGEKHRMLAHLEEEYESLRRHTEAQLRQAVTQALNAVHPHQLTSAALLTALDVILPPIFKQEFRATYRRLQQQLEQTLNGYRQRAEKLVATVRMTAAELFNVPYAPATDAVPPLRQREPYWKTYYWEESIGPISPSAFDRLLPSRWRRSRINQRAHRQIEKLVTINAGKLRETLVDQIDRAFTHFSRSLDERLSAAIAGTRGAIAAMLDKRQNQAPEVEMEKQRLLTAIQPIDAFVDRLSRSATNP